MFSMSSESIPTILSPEAREYFIATAGGPVMGPSKYSRKEADESDERYEVCTRS